MATNEDRKDAISPKSVFKKSMVDRQTLWLRKFMLNRRLKKLLGKHPEKRNHAVEMRLEQEIQRIELALEWFSELKR